MIFTGFANFYRRFIKDYSRIALPLTQLTRENEESKALRPHVRADIKKARRSFLDQNLKLPPDAREAFDRLK